MSVPYNDLPCECRRRHEGYSYAAGHIGVALESLDAAVRELDGGLGGGDTLRRAAWSLTALQGVLEDQARAALDEPVGVTR